MAKKKKKFRKLGVILRELEEIFNKYIRLRDSFDGYFKCISCCITKPITDMNAGHFWPVNGYKGIRFDEENVHGECEYCNCWDKSHLIPYAENLRDKLGLVEYQALNERAAAYKMIAKFKWHRVDLEELIIKYKLKVKDHDGR